MSNQALKPRPKLVQMTLPLSDLKSQGQAAGSLRRLEAVKEALKEALRDSGLPRETVADELSRLTGEHLSVHVLNNWVAEEKKDRNIPLHYCAALSVVLGDLRPLQAAFGGTGVHVMGEEDYGFYELGKMAAEDAQRAKKKRQIKERLGL
jgi:hypothetical protein